MRAALAVIYVSGLVFAEALRIPLRLRRARSVEIWHSRAGSRSAEIIVLLGIWVGLWVLPGAYAFTSVLSGFDYALPSWMGWCGIGVFAAGLAVRWRAHAALGSLWSPTLETADRHSLVTRGIYASIRHPIYASMLLWAAAQPLLLQNTLAGPAGLVTVGLLWLVRVPREEAMMLERFGDAYRDYMQRTGRLFPR